MKSGEAWRVNFKPPIGSEIRKKMSKASEEELTII